MLIYLISLVILSTAAYSQQAPASAAAWLDSCIQVIERYAITKENVDWAKVRSESMDLLQRDDSPDGCAGALDQVVKQLSDRHSRVYQKRGSDVRHRAELPGPSGKMVESRIGYVRLPGLSGDGEDYIATTERLITQLLSQGAVCWIIDLRGNRGGNLWPMLSATGQFLGSRPVGNFVFPNGRRTAWRVPVASSEEDATDEELINLRNAPVAVLQDSLTASSGEAVLISFKSLPQMRSFGTPTTGVPSNRARFDLGRGVTLQLAVAWMADIGGKIYTEAIPPDVEVVGYDETEKAAIAWLRSISKHGL